MVKEVRQVTVHYHGTPIWGLKGEVHRIAVRGAGAFVSYARPDQLKQSLAVADSVGIDNGAFSAWKRKLKIDWSAFYRWLLPHYDNPRLGFFIIPDSIDGTEKDNKALINLVPKMFKDKATPVWHLHESMEKLDWLCSDFERIAFGSSGEYSVIRTAAWQQRMVEAFELMYKKQHKTRVHGLRMLDGRVLGHYPLASADSTNLACNVPKYKVKYPKLGSDLTHRCAILKGAIEKVHPPTMAQYINRGK